MIVIQSNKILSFQEMKRSYQFVVAVRDAAKGFNDYSVARTEKDPGNVILIGKAKLDALIANLDPALSLPVKTKTLNIDMGGASTRAEEMYRLVLGQSNFPGNEDYSDALDNQSFEKKILVKGTQLDIQVENLVADGGSVTATYPILDADGVSARKPGSPLDVTGIADIGLGVVELDDSGSPVADGVAVELVYQTKEYLIVNVQDQYKHTQACLIAKELNDYLIANATV